jgi:hypothetical protein
MLEIEITARKNAAAQQTLGRHTQRGATNAKDSQRSISKPKIPKTYLPFS